MMAVQDTHLTNGDVEEIKTVDGKAAYTFYSPGREN